MKEGSLARTLGLTDEQSRAVWHAAQKVAHADGEPGERGRHLLDVLQRALAVHRTELEDVDLALAFPDERQRRALVDALVIPACIEGDVTLEKEKAVLAIAARLGVESHWAELLPSLRRRSIFSVKRAMASRSPDARRIFRRTWDEEGALGVLRAGLFVLGMHRDEKLAARFHALASCPEGSFGAAVTSHFASYGLAFPGERNGIPERMVHHDLMHVINGYDTTPAGECELAGFYAGSADGDAFTFIVTVLATFHLGLRVSPSAVEPARGAFDPERVLAAFLRGRRLEVDVMGQWDYWTLMPLPFEEARDQLGIGERTRQCTEGLARRPNEPRE